MNNTPRKLNVPADPEKRLSKPLKTLIVTDYMGSFSETPEEEAAYIAEVFAQRGIDLDYEHSYFVHKESEVNPKLIIIDYGGILPGNDTDIMQLRQLANWLEEHPSRLGLIWTSFTHRAWQFELADQFKHVDNLLVWQPVNEHGIDVNMTIDKEWKHQDEIIDRIVAWFKEENEA